MTDSKKGTHEGDERRRSRSKGSQGSESGSQTPPSSSASSSKSSARSKEAERQTERERIEVLAALEAGITEALPGVEILDRDLVFDAGGRADLAAVDPTGRLVLVMVAGDDPDQTALDALDLLVYARLNASLLVRHMGSRRVDPGLDARAVVIDPSGEPVLARRLSAIAAAGIEVFSVRTLASAAGERSYLVAPGASVRRPAAPEGAGVEAFLDALPMPLQSVGRELATRMARLDDELFATADQRTLVWRWNGEVLARFECQGESLTASIAPHHEPSPVRGMDDVEGVLEDALARLVVEFDHGSLVPMPPPVLSSRPQRVAGDLPADQPMLTQEERDAFFD